MKHILKIMLLVLFICFGFCVNLQARNDLKFDYAIKIGSACTSAITQDRDGFIWIGSLTGLIKYDGYKLKYYTSSNSTISGEYITSILEDKDGLLWIATSANGLNTYNKETNTFTHYRHDPENTNSITDNAFNYSPHTIIENKAGILWIGTRNGLSKYNKERKLFTHYKHVPNNPNSISDDDIWVITEDKNGVLWIGTREGGLNKFDPKTGNFTHYKHEADNPKGLSDNWIYSILEDREGTLWVGTKSGGLNKFDNQTETFTHYRHDPEDSTSLSTNEVYSIYETRAGDIWIHAYIDSTGLNKFHKKSGTVIRYRYDPKNPDGLRSDSMFAVYEDRSGILWVLYNTEGLGKYDRENRKFTYHRHYPNNDKTIGAPCIVPIYEGSKGGIWLGSVSGGLSRYDRTLNEFKTYTNTPDDSYTIRNNYPTGIYEDSKGTFWISTWQNTLSIFDRKKERVVKHYDFDTAKAAMIIFEDRSNPDILWLGCQGYGLVRFNKKSEEIRQYRYNTNNPASLSNDNVLSMVEDKDDPDIIWIAPMAGGLNRFDKKTETFTHYKHNPDNPESLGADMLWDVYEDSAGNFWVATGGSGLNRFSKNSAAFKHYNQDNGFPANNVFSILEDDEGNLWCSSDQGLIRFNPENETVRLYTKDDNICSFIFISRLKTADGQMWFGGSDGVISFYPKKIQDNPFVPPVKLTSLKQGGDDMDLNKAPESTKEITLGWRDNFFEFEYAALNYTKPEKNLYKYMLQGIDENWYEAGTRRFGRYSGLPGGKYTLKIKGSNNDGVWNEEGLFIKVVVETPFWKSWWFYCMLALPIIFYVIKLQTEIFDRKQAEDALRESERKYRTLIENIPQKIFYKDRNSIYITCNENYARDLNITTDEIFGKTDYDFFPKELAEKYMQDDRRIIQAGKTEEIEEKYLQDGREFNVQTIKTPIWDENKNLIGLLGIFWDITDRIKSQEQIKASLREKEVLLREIHHRVKNNMQVITTLLLLQSDKIKDKQYADMFKESQDRIKSMALVHEKLYRTESLTEIDFKEYVKSLVNSLFRSYGVNPDRIDLKMDVEDVSLGLENAIPCGLIINELVSNSLKYAFPENREGEIKIALYSINADDLVLEVNDNGIGMPEELDIRNTESIGLHLVTILSEDQLDGRIELNRVNGTLFNIEFKKQIYKARI